MNLTRRSTLQGVGAAGLAGIAGNAFVSVGSAQETQQQDGAALRVAHASPDTPTVEVHLDEAGAGGAGDGTPEDGGAGTPTEDGAGAGTPEDGTPENGTPAGGDGPLVEDLGFREVSNYEELDPGTYRLRIVATEDTGLLDEIFGDEGEERVVYDESVELDRGTTYTAVAFGELARADLGGAGADTGAGETPVGGQTPGDGGQTPVGGQTPGAGDQTPGDDGGVGGGTTPAAGETPAGDDSAGDGDVLVEGLSFGEHEYFQIDAGDHTLEFRESQAAGGDALGGDATPGGAGTTPTDGPGGEDETTPIGTPGADGTTPTDDIGGNGGTTPAGTPGADGTPAGGGATPRDGGVGGGNDRAFQVAVLEDELSVTGAGTTGDEAGTPMGGETPGDDVGGEGDGVGGEGDETPGQDETPGGGGTTPGDGETSRIRVFHAVPDVDAMDVVSVDGDGDGGLLGGDGEETPGEGTPDGEGTPGGDTGDGDATPVGDDEQGVGETEEDGAQQADISPEGGVVYSGFAVGYFDPEAAAGAADENGTPTGGGAETPTDGGAGTPTEDDGGTLDGGEETPEGGTPTDGEEDGGITEDPEGEEFEFVTVEDATDGERSDGGTGGGLFSSMAAAPASSD